MKQFKVKARQVVLYEKIVEAKSEEEAFQIFYETRDDDDIALDKDTECDECGCFMCDCVCGEPDVMYADHYDD